MEGEGSNVGNHTRGVLCSWVLCFPMITHLHTVYKLVFYVLGLKGPLSYRTGLHCSLRLFVFALVEKSTSDAVLLGAWEFLVPQPEMAAWLL